MKFKFDHTPQTLMEELKNNEMLFWDGCAIPLNSCCILVGHSSFVDRYPKERTLEEILDFKNFNPDYSKHESKISFKIFVNNKYKDVCEVWSSEFEYFIQESDFEKFFNVATNSLVEHYNIMNSLVIGDSTDGSI